MEPPARNRTGTPSRPRRLVMLAAAAAVVTACQAVLGVFGGGPEGPEFPHAVHLEEGLDCTTCHAGAEEKASAGFPASADGCMLCHGDIDEDKPRERTVAAFLVDGEPRWLKREDPYAREVKFHHGKHYEAEVDCESCHAPQTGGEGPGLEISGGKPRCLACHAKTERGNDCAVCHSILREDAPPPSHGGNWRILHGSHSHTKIAGLGETTCEQCHDQSSCNRCHQEEAPRSHTNFWRRRGHGLTAAIDRSRCMACHNPDYCVRCHRVTQPLSHRGAFGPPLNLHCASCHLPPTGLGCGACHENFPAHVPGPGTPGNAAHMTASSPSDCLACHLALQHPNPGGDCRTCHR